MKKIGNGAILLTMAALARAQEDPFADEAATGTPDPAATAAAADTASDTSFWQQLGQRITEMTPTQWAILAAMLVGSWILGWILFRILLPRAMPSSASAFGCFTTVAAFLLIAAFWFIPVILGTILPDWLGWTLLGIIAVVFFVILIARRRR